MNFKWSSIGLEFSSPLFQIAESNNVSVIIISFGKNSFFSGLGLHKFIL